MINFYGSPYSPFSTRVHLLLEELGIPYKYHQVNLRDTHERQVLERLNPFVKVPAIEVNGFALGESHAILRYLAERYQRFDLWPVNLEDRARVDMMTEFTHSHITRWLNSLAWNLVHAAKFGMRSDEATIREARDVLPGLLLRLEREIAGRVFLCGAELTLADISLIPFASQYREAQVSLDHLPNFAAWITRMTARSSWQAVMAR